MQNVNFKRICNITINLRKTFAQFMKKLWIEELESTTSPEAFTAGRLIPLDKENWTATNQCG